MAASPSAIISRLIEAAPPAGFVCPPEWRCTPPRPEAEGLGGMVGFFHHLHSGEEFGKLGEAMQARMASGFLAPGKGRGEVLTRAMEMAETLGGDTFVRQSRALQRRRDQQAVLRKCKVPALVLCGEHDMLCPVKRHAFMAEMIPYAKLTVLEDAGHWPSLEAPEATTAALRDWLHQPLVLQ